jgi:hypothetical protein
MQMARFFDLTYQVADKDQVDEAISLFWDHFESQYKGT